MFKKRTSIVWCKIPKSGLGNQLFPIVTAILYAEKHNLKIYFTNYHQLKIGPYLRKEKTKRNYKKYFSFEKSLFTDIYFRLKLLILTYFYNVIKEPSLNIVQNDNTIYLFNNIPHWSDYFSKLKPYRLEAIDVLNRIVRASILTNVAKMTPPTVGIHVRMGDFKLFNPTISFAEQGSTRTPLAYFRNIIKVLQNTNNEIGSISVFSDGRISELQELLCIDNTKLIEGNKDIEDLLLLSKSKIIVVSVNSTFSYWAAFISNATIIRHPDHFHSFIRATDFSSEQMEYSIN
jgi:hypothetical protein